MLDIYIYMLDGNRNPQPIFFKACYLVACSDNTLTYPYTIIIIIYAWWVDENLYMHYNVSCVYVVSWGFSLGICLWGTYKIGFSSNNLTVIGKHHLYQLSAHIEQGVKYISVHKNFIITHRIAYTIFCTNK